MIKAIAWKTLGLLGLDSVYAMRRGALAELGWYRSYREKAAVDGQGRPIPWMTYAAIAFIEGRLRPEMKVFEYGSGNSTLWWAARVGHVTACEHDRGWYEQVRGRMPGNVELMHLELEYGGAYAQAIAAYEGCFDVIVIDGRDRVNCAKHCLGALKPEGVIIWDNSDRAEYQEGYDFLEAQGFKRIALSGLLPIITELDETSIFYRPGNCFGI